MLQILPDPQKIFQNPTWDAFRTRIGKSFETGTSGIIELGGVGHPKPDPGGFRRASKNLQKFVYFWEWFLNDVRGIFGANKASQIHQNPWKIDAKRRPQLGFNFLWIFQWFFFDFAIFREPWKAFRYYKQRSFEASTAFRKNQKKHNKNIPTTFIFPPKIFPKSCPSRVQDGIRIHNDFLFDFERLWKAKMVPCWTHVEAQDTTKFDQNRCPKRGRENDEKV